MKKEDLDRLMRDAGPLSLWRREAERRGIDWRREVIESFEDALPDLSERLIHEVWPERAVEGVRKAFNLPEDAHLLGEVDVDVLGNYSMSVWYGGFPLTERTPLYKTSFRRGSSFILTLEKAEKWAQQIREIDRARMYLDLMKRRVFGRDRASYGSAVNRAFVDEDKELWIVVGAYISHRDSYRGRKRDIKMPLSCKDDAEEAMLMFHKHLEPETIRVPVAPFSTNLDA